MAEQKTIQESARDFVNKHPVGIFVALNLAVLAVAYKFGENMIANGVAKGELRAFKQISNLSYFR